MKNSKHPGEISIDYLRTSNDWDRIRSAWKELEKDSSCPPWCGFRFTELSWICSGKPETYSILLKQKDEPIGGCFLRVEFQKYAGRSVKTLRLFDDIFSCIGPF